MAVDHLGTCRLLSTTHTYICQVGIGIKSEAFQVGIKLCIALDMAKEPYPSETADRYIVRFPDGMRDQIAEFAKENNRSMNAEIVSRLEASIQETIRTRSTEMQILKMLDKMPDIAKAEVLEYMRNMFNTDK